MLTSLISSGAGDRHGRKPIALTGAIGVAIAGVLSGLATQYWHLALLRGLLGGFMGIGIGPCVALTGKHYNNTTPHYSGRYPHHSYRNKV